MRRSDLGKKRKVVGVLRKAGFTKVKSRGPHENWEHPDTKKKVQIPHGRRIDIYLAISVLKQAGIEIDLRD